MKLAAWLLSAAAAVLAGCAAPPRDPGKAEVAPGQGLLAARVTTQIPDVPMRPHDRAGLVGAGLMVQNVDLKREYRMTRTASRETGTVGFLEPLPPGWYRLERVGTQRGTASLQSLPELFEVRADRVTDLGTIVLVFANLEVTQEAGFLSTKVKTGRYIAVQAHNPPDTAAALRALTPEMRTRMRADEPLRAVVQPNEKLNRDALAFAKVNAGFVSKSMLAPNQKVAFGRKLGQILTWEPDADRWRVYDTGRTLNVTSVAFAGDGSLLAGMEEGVVLAQRDGAWRELAWTGGSGPVEFVGQAPSGEYFALVGGPEEHKLVSASDPGTARSMVQSFPTTERARAWLVAGRIIVIVWPHDLKPASIHVFDPATRQWSQREAPKEDEYEVLNDGAIVATSRRFDGVHMRRLDGFGAAEWRTNAMDRTISAYFADATTAYRLRFGESGVREIERSADGGFTWTPVGQTAQIGLLHPLPKPQWLLMSSPVGQLMLTQDGGAVWEPLGLEFR